MCSPTEELLDRLSRSVSIKLSAPDDAEGPQMVSAGSLVEILDGIILLYNLAAHKQLGKVRAHCCVTSWECVDGLL